MQPESLLKCFRNDEGPLTILNVLLHTYINTLSLFPRHEVGDRSKQGGENIISG